MVNASIVTSPSSTSGHRRDRQRRLRGRHEHLAPHAKNLGLHPCLEQSVLGLPVFLALGLAAVRRAFRLRSDRPTFSFAVLAAASALATLGAFDSILDEPRLVLLVYFVLFAVLHVPNAQGVKRA